MTLREIIESGIMIEGKYHIKEFVEDDVISHYDGENFADDFYGFNDAVKDASVLYMYVAGGALQIEIKTEDCE